jgi:hypothetical protein
MNDVVTPHVILDIYIFYFIVCIWKFKILFFSTYKLNVWNTSEGGLREAEDWGWEGSLLLSSHWHCPCFEHLW